MLKSSIWLALLLLPVAEVVASDDNTIQCAVTLSEYLPKGIYRKEINGSYVWDHAPVATFLGPPGLPG